MRKERVSMRRNVGAVLILAFLAVIASPVGAQAQDKPEKGAQIVWDDWGVPHIYANEDSAGFRAYGWAQMVAHADRILGLYGRARGRSAEYWGAKKAARRCPGNSRAPLRTS